MGKNSKNVIVLEQTFKEIEHLKTKVESCDVDQNRIEILETKLNLLDSKLEKLFSNLTVIESEDLFDSFLKYKDFLLELNVDLKGKSKIIRENNSNSEQFGDERNNQSHSIIKFPKLELPPFYGDQDNWISFKELFTSSILNNPKLTDIEKLQYLNSTVRGNAFKLIRGFPLKTENLKNCWEILCNRYENKRQIALNQINKMFAMKLNKVSDSKSLLHLIDTCNEVVRNLQTLGLESNPLSDLIFINFMVGKLEPPIRQRWELQLDSGDIIPDLNTFRVFIERESRGGIQENKSQPFVLNKRNSSEIPKRPSVVNAVLTKDNKCLLCNQNHQLFKCETFNGMQVNDRWKFIKSKDLCQNCLRSNHKVETCKISINCKNCSARHHTLLHIYRVNSTPQNQSEATQSISNSAQSHHHNVLLSTALVNVKSASGRTIQCRALIDNASQNSLMSKQCAERLNLTLVKTTHRLLGINGIQAETCLNSASIQFAPYFNSNYQSLNVLIVNRVTAPLPNFHLSSNQWSHTKNMILADPNFTIVKDIDLLLGADIFAELLDGEVIKGNPGEPAAIPTTLGYILSGPISQPEIQEKSSIICHTLKEFFTCESLPTINNNFNDPAEKLFTETVQRNSKGRYIVHLPIIEQSSLGDSYAHAQRVFSSLEKKLHSNKKLRDEYIKFMDEYIQMKHMSEIDQAEINSKPHFYLPHHAVFNVNSATTKLRVVFNGSAKSSNGKSLNSILLKGPKLQTDIFSILIKFRFFKIAISADIEKMYRQILVSDQDRHYQRILWRKNASEPIKHYKLNTITYGTASAPFLALRTIKQLCKDEKHNFPKAAAIANKQFYVDDFMGGADSLEEAQSIVNEMTQFCNSGGFPLRKWTSNNPHALAGIPDALKSTAITHPFQQDSSQRVLGLEWHLDFDSLQVHISKTEQVTTKRDLLSIIARTFDPLGILSPCTLILKILMQKVWKIKIDWDKALPTNILEIWNKFHSEITCLKEINVPRYLKSQPSALVELHGFCDASLQAYAAVVYLRSISEIEYEQKINIVASKTRISPIKSVTLPRLELCGALLLSELVNAIINSSENQITKIYLWCDSKIVLCWISNPPLKGNQYVLHRVTKINSLVDKQFWHHVPGKLNPADNATRGLFPEQLKNCSSWLKGPDWLYHFNNNFSFPDSSIQMDVDPELSENCVSLITQTIQTEEPAILTKFSSYSKLLRVTAFVHRFINNAKSSTKSTDPLTCDELNSAETSIIKILQRSAFSTEVKLLQQNEPLPNTSPLLSLNLFLDSQNIIRVGGRLRHSPNLSYDAKHQILLPKGHHVTSLLIKYYHLISLHAGPDLVLSLIRRKYWIPHGRSTVKHEIHKCLTCIKYNAKPIHQLMGDLPPSRITPSRVFENVGIDYAGPITTKCQHKRKSTKFKSYICLFVCMSTKAIHLELVSDLSTASFLKTLKRFVSRRGCPNKIFSDNGKVFVGANAWLKQVLKIERDPSTQNFIAQNRISWHFMPPYGPNFGGLWESSVKLAKRHLHKSLNSSILTFEDITTLLCLIEACLNSRPLTSLSTDPNDVNALTPGHFIIGAPLLHTPDSYTHTNPSLSLSSRWNLIQTATKKFWSRWQREYLSSLSTRHKWKAGHHHLTPGQLVLLKDGHLLPQQWTLARIKTIHPGQDGICRVVTVQTKDGVYRRPISKICLLPEAISPPAGEHGQ